MEQEAVYFGENDIIKSAFHKNKRAISINEVDIAEIVLSCKRSYSKESCKYFIPYRHKGNTFPLPLCVKLPQMNSYAKYFDKNNKYINLLVNDKEILKKYSEIWNKVKSLIKKEFNSEPVYLINTLKLKEKFTMIGYTQIFSIIKHPKIMSILRAYL